MTEILATIDGKTACIDTPELKGKKANPTEAKKRVTKSISIK